MLITTSQLARLVIPAGIKVVSLDLFDTLLLRNVDPPEIAIRLAAERIAERALLPMGAQEYLALRGRVEGGLRAEAKERGGDAECSLAEISCRITEELRLPSETAKRLVDAELEVESLIIDPVPEVVALIGRIKERYRVVAVSDTYFDSSQIVRLLESFGLGTLFDRIYASCDQRATKRSGRLFDRLVAEEGVAAGEIMHLGDNFHGDYLSPRKRAITAACLYDPPMLTRKRVLRRALAGGAAGDLYRLYFGRSCRAGRGGGADPFRFGREVVGPLLTIFIARLLEELGGSDCRYVFFVARDGFLLQKLYRQVSGDRGGREDRYLYLSRYTAALASIREVGPREVELVGFACRTLRDALRRLGVGGLAEADTVAAGLGWELDAPVEQATLYRRLERLLADDVLRDQVLLAASRMREGLERYLEERNFFGAGRTAALVDVGWHGTIQQCLQEAFGHRPDFPRLVGYYLGVMPPVVENDTPRSGLLLDYRQASPAESALALHQELWELATRAFHGTTVGYTGFAGHTLPVLKREGSAQSRMAFNRFALEIQRGIIDCVRGFSRMAGVLPPDLALLKEAALAEYDLAVGFPDGDLARLFESIPHSDDFGSGRFTPLVRTFAWRDVLVGRRFLDDFLANPWREASLVRSRLPLLSVYHAAKKLVCWRRGARHYLP